MSLGERLLMWLFVVALLTLFSALIGAAAWAVLTLISAVAAAGFQGGLAAAGLIAGAATLIVVSQ